jgi:predicted dehydrogenase
MAVEPTPPPLRTAVIGCGAIANEHLQFLSESPLCTVAAVCDTSPAAAAFAQKRFKVGAVFTDSNDMLAALRPDVVHVLTPPHTHFGLITAALEAGAHVICEKPMTANASDTAKLLKRAREDGKVLVESRNYLFNDIIIRVRELIASGRLGPVIEIDLMLSLDFLSGPFGDLSLTGPGARLPGGAVHDFLPHLAYLFLILAGIEGEVDNVRGYFANRSGNPRVGFDHLDALVAVGRKRGRLRVVADVQPDMFRLYVRGQRASLEADLFNPYLRFDGPPNIGKRTPLGQIGNGFALTKAGLRNLRDKIVRHGTYQGMPRMLEAIYSAIQSGADPPFSETEMIDSAKLIDRIVDLAEDS